jgi:hypothetical protein
VPSVRKQSVGEVIVNSGAHETMILDSFSMPLIFIILIGLALITLMIVVSKKTAKRTADFAAAAEELGLRFSKDAGSDLETRFADFRLFKNHGSIKNVTRGETSQARLSIFHYAYPCGSGNTSGTRSQTVVAMESEKLQVPPFHLRPEHILDVVGSVLGLQDIDFDHHPGFSKAYVLQSADEQETRTFFDDPLLDFFAEQTSITFETKEGAFIYYRHDKTIKPNELREFLAQGYAVFKAFTDRLERA